MTTDAIQTLTDLIKRLDPKGKNPERVAAQLTGTAGAVGQPEAQAFLDSAAGKGLRNLENYIAVANADMAHRVAESTLGAADASVQQLQQASKNAWDIFRNEEGNYHNLSSNITLPKEAKEAQEFLNRVSYNYDHVVVPKYEAGEVLGCVNKMKEAGNAAYSATTHPTHLPLAEHITQVRAEVAKLAADHAQTITDTKLKKAFLKHAGELDGLAESYYTHLKTVLSAKDNAAEASKVFLGNAEGVASRIISILKDSVKLVDGKVAKDAGLKECHFQQAVLHGMKKMAFDESIIDTAPKAIMSHLAEMYGELKQVLAPVSHSKAAVLGGALAVGGVLARGSHKDEHGEKHKKFGIISTTATTMGVALLSAAALAKFGHGRTQELAQKGLDTALGWAGSLSR